MTIGKLLLICCLAIPIPINAQEDDAEASEDCREISDVVSTLYCDFGFEEGDLKGRLEIDVPESPAFTILGVSPESVVNPDTPRELAIGLLRGVDADGNLQSGLAVDTRPYLLIRGRELTIADYRTKPVVAQLSRISVSLATSSGESDADRADRMGLGIRWTPVDKGDPRNSPFLDECFGQTGEGITNRLAEIEERNDPQEFLAFIQSEEYLEGRRTVRQDCLNRFNEFPGQAFNAQRLQIGLGLHDSDVEEFDVSGSAAWMSYAHPIGPRGQMIAHIRSADDVLVAVDEPDVAYRVVDYRTAALRFRYGGANGGLLFEFARKEEESTATPKERYWQALVGVEFRIREDVWLRVAVGDTDRENRDDPVFSGQMRWAVGRQSLFP